MIHRDSQPEIPIKPRRKFRFSLLTFLLFVFGTGTFLGVWATMIEPIRIQWKAAEPLIALGVTFETVPSGMPRWMTAFLPIGQSDYIECVNFNRNKATQENVAALTRFPRLERLYMERSYATDEHCTQIAKIRTLRRLAIWGTQVTDKGAQLLASLPNLEIVDVTHTTVSWRTELFFQDYPDIKLRSNFAGYVHDVKIAEIVDIKQLKVPVLSINLSNACDDDIALAIDSLSSLTSISLAGNSMDLTYDGLMKIRDCRRIESLTIGHYDEPGHPVEAVPNIIRHVCRIWGPRSKKASIVRQGGKYLTIWLFEEDETKIISPEIRLEIGSDRLLPSHLEGISGLENVGTLELEGFDLHTIVVLKSMTNLKHLSISNVVSVPESYANEIANIDQLDSFNLSARLRWNEFQLPDDFFQHWKSQKTLRAVLIRHADVTWQQLRPLLDFPKLNRLMIEAKAFTQNASSPRDFLGSLREHFEVKGGDNSTRAKNKNLQ